MKQQERDEYYMRRCLQLAQNGRMESRPNPMVGCVIVAPSSPHGGIRGGGFPVCNTEERIIGEGWHVRCGEGHAEVNAFASVKADDECLLPQATVYVSLEPCAHYGKTPPCADLIISKGVRRVVVGCIDPFARVQGRGIQKIRDAGIEVTVGVCEQECQWLNRRFFTFHRENRPYIILKWAQSSNGFLDDNGQTVAFSTPLTQMLVHKLRAEEDAILVGRVTDEREHPRLDVRHWSGPSPVRFVLSHEHPWEEVLTTCRERQLQSLIVEGGCRTLQWFLDQGMWDEIRVETSPKTVSVGTKAPELPASLNPATTLSPLKKEGTFRRLYNLDGNMIARYWRNDMSK